MSVVATVVIVANMLFNPVPAFLSYYGADGDGFYGKHHGAYWHGDSCGLPDVVDEYGFGTAAPRWIPYCSKVMLCADDRCVEVAVVDRQRDDVIYGNWHFDVWPAVADELGLLNGVGVKTGVFYYFPCRLDDISLLQP